MSFFDRILRRSPTSDWLEERSVLLVADLDRFQLNGVGLGEDVERLRFLGPSASRAFDYPAKGLQLDVGASGSLQAFVMALRDGVYLSALPPEQVRAFPGRVRMSGRDWAPRELRGESDFVTAWGDPYWRDEDEDEVLLFFEFDRCEVQVELSLEGVPHVLVVAEEPLMADADQREAYGVTKAWPPDQWAQVR